MARSRTKMNSQLTSARVSEYSTKQLSERTWRDFERLFETHPAPGAYPCWCMYNHRCGPNRERKEIRGPSGSSKTIATRKRWWRKDAHTAYSFTRRASPWVGVNLG